jgi:hypothetical protein
MQFYNNCKNFPFFLQKNQETGNRENREIGKQETGNRETATTLATWQACQVGGWMDGEVMEMEIGIRTNERTNERTFANYSIRIYSQ